MNAHTPGPWIRASARGLTLIAITNADQSRVIGSVIESKLSTATNAAFGETVRDPEGEANVRLIVAAPELLKALQLAVRQNSHDMQMTGEELRQCETAIAKATGEQA